MLLFAAHRSGGFLALLLLLEYGVQLLMVRDHSPVRNIGTVGYLKLQLLAGRDRLELPCHRR